MNKFSNLKESLMFLKSKEFRCFLKNLNILDWITIGGSIVMVSLGIMASARLASLSGFGILFLVGYFLPTITAVMRTNHNKLAIFVLNLLFGWTFIGWAVALIWALTKQPPQD